MYYELEKSQVRIEFPSSMIRESIAEKYQTYFEKRGMFPYQNITDFLLSTLQEVDLGNLNVGSTQQTKYLGKINRYKGSQNRTYKIQTRDITFTFKSVHSHINWFILLEEISTFQTNKYPDTHLDPMIISFLDHNGRVIRSISFERMVYTSLDQLTLDYTDDSDRIKTFTMSVGVSGAYFLDDK